MQTKLNKTKMFSPPYCSPQNPQKLTRVTIRVYAGRAGSARAEPGRYGFNSVWTRFEIQLCVTVAQIITHLAHFHLDCDFECHAVCDKGRCGFTLQVEAGRCGSNRFNTDINPELKSLQKVLNTTQKVFLPYRSHGILRN
jgi:hypothetical protein